MFQEINKFDIYLPSFARNEKIVLHQIFKGIAQYDIEKLIKNPFYCLVPDKFKNYERWVSENVYFNNNNHYLEEGFELDDDYLHNIKLEPFSNFMNEFVFFKFGLSQEKELTVIEIFDTKALFDYWTKRNETNNFDKYKTLGIGKTIFDLLPNNSSYYDNNKVCGCGNYGCGNNEVLYYKYENSFSVVFTIWRNYLLCFDIEDWCKNEKYSDDDYSEEYVLSQEDSSTFEFIFESKDFKVFQKSVHLLKTLSS